MPRRLVTSLLALAALLPAAPAHGAVATFFGGDAVDAGAEIASLGDVDVARDGSGAVVYLKREGDVPHVFVSRLVEGVWQAPERVDAGLAGAASEAVVGASDGGRLAVAFVSDGQLHTAVRGAGQTTWPAPVALAAPARGLSIDLAISGTGYLTWAGAGDVRAARLERAGAAFTALPAPLDIDPAAAAGEGTDRPRVAVSADGVALVAWGEAGHLYARRLFELRPSAAPQRLDVDSFAGAPGGAADSVDLDAEDDSSFAWAAFRQTIGGTPRILARRLRGSLFDDPVDVGGDAVGPPRIDLNGRGQGMVGSTAGGGTPFAAALQLDVFGPPFAVGDPSAVPAQPTPATAEGGDGVLAWMASAGGDVAVQARGFDADKPGAVVTVSRPELGSVDAGAGFDTASNRAGDVVIAYVQGSGAERRLAIASYDRAPGAFVGTTSQSWRNAAQPKLSWGASFELWGTPLYTVYVDGAPVGQTRATSLTTKLPVADGVHGWFVVATDRRNQQTRTKTRELRVDATPPAAAIRVAGVRRERRTLTLYSGASDAGAPAGSGLKSVVFDFGDGTPRAAVTGAVKHRFRRGTFTVTATATDRAGNVTVVQRRLRIAKAAKG